MQWKMDLKMLLLLSLQLLTCLVAIHLWLLAGVKGVIITVTVFKDCCNTTNNTIENRTKISAMNAVYAEIYLTQKLIWTSIKDPHDTFPKVCFRRGEVSSNFCWKHKPPLLINKSVSKGENNLCCVICGKISHFNAAEGEAGGITQQICFYKKTEKYYENRLAYIAGHKEMGENPYLHKFEAVYSVPKYVGEYESLESGRIMSKRSSSSKLFFYDLHGGGPKVQVMDDARKSELSEEEFSKFHSGMKRGDIVGIKGFPGKSKRGELSIFPKSFTVLSHCLHMMPRRKSGTAADNAKKSEVRFPGSGRNPESYILKDQETRYRQRYLDLMLNPDVRETFKTRTKIIDYVKSLLNDRDFLEVETPMLNMIAGGAAARPFATHHNPEFTTCEFYWAYADYNDLMDETEKMLSGMVKKLTGGYKITYHANGLDNEPIEIDLMPPLRRIDMIDELEKTAKLDIPKDFASDEANRYLADACAKFEVKCPPLPTTARMLDKVCNAYTELNEPVVQRQRFTDKLKWQKSSR